MAVGDLSRDQAAYVTYLAGRTGLPRTVAVAWVGAESGWNRTKPGHNYLNVGPGRTYPSASHAAADAAKVLDHDRYAAVRAAIKSRDGARIIAALEASPWDAANYSNGALRRVWEQLSGETMGADDRGVLDRVGDAVSDTVDRVGDVVDRANPVPSAEEVRRSVLEVSTYAVLLLAGLSLTGLGLWRATASPRSTVIGAGREIAAAGITAASRGTVNPSA